MFERIPETVFHFGEPLAPYLNGVTENWLKVAPQSNPAMLEMFRARDRLPGLDVLYFGGEFAGKYLTSAVQMLRVTGDSTLREYLQGFVQELIACQDKDGYLGPFPRSVRLLNRLPEGETNLLGGQTWDTWGHYHIMLGLLLWHEETGDSKAMRAVRKIADLMCRMYLGAPIGKRLVDSGARDSYGWTGTHVNLSPIHSLALLDRKTKVERYRALALQIADEFAAEGLDGPLAGDYIRTALAGMEFFETPRPRWESLHPIMGIAELYRSTGNEEYRRAFEHIWWSIQKYDRHNNGG
ncbi:MAG TPA: beta-L-arabinofuranosidase domain-containing protein, partial [Anaerolineae bacterium]|nr:beta-L-arabinofuranosidase domain-containing protein [Anaerolineae bacterium]